MSKVVVRSSDLAGFFDRARAAGRRADQGLALDGSVTLAFEDPQAMFSVLSDARRRLMREVMHESKTIGQLSACLHRKRSAA